ncbi:hypothetical protein LTR37_003842 [Vermiconidia calcicola]|uniref:Uncharacterized protein n=1 Tax=Vermiconidia calcicola TaxID=1690605 RepID=A0ACC3NPA7_9PEZI|nr:hypothetical protein LTR37_003842 [Vermiconidia calcicola]
MVYQPVVLDLLQNLGILKQVEELAYLNRQGLYWRDIRGNELGHLPMPEGEHVLLLGQYRMATLLLNEIAKHTSVDVRFGMAFSGCEQSDDRKHVKVLAHDTTTDVDTIMTSNWVVGTDGANSNVRKSLCIPFEGFSFTDFTMVGADVYYDFAKEEYGTIMNFVVDPEDWAVVIYTGQQKDLKPVGEAPPLWRIAYVESTKLSSRPEDVLERARERCARYTKNKKRLEVARAEPYRLHQRCAAEAIKGRVLLAGDALHSNNPIGGLGLTTGICDAFAVGNALARVCTGQAHESLVAEAANDRRETWLNTTDKISQMNLQRLRSEEAEDVKERNEYFAGLRIDPELPKKIRTAIQGMAGRDFAIRDATRLSRL